MYALDAADTFHDHRCVSNTTRRCIPTRCPPPPQFTDKGSAHLSVPVRCPVSLAAFHVPSSPQPNSLRRLCPVPRTIDAMDMRTPRPRMRVQRAVHPNRPLIESHHHLLRCPVRPRAHACSEPPRLRTSRGLHAKSILLTRTGEYPFGGRISESAPK
jgi:hypothetical protein